MSKELMLIPKYGDFNEVVKRMGCWTHTDDKNWALDLESGKNSFAPFFIYYIFYEKFIAKNIYNLYKT